MSPGCSTSAVWMWRGRAAGWRLLLRWEEFGWVQTFLWAGVSHQGLSFNLALLGMSIKAKQQLFWSYEDDECGCYCSAWRKFRSLICLLSFSRQEFSPCAPSLLPCFLSSKALEECDPLPFPPCPPPPSELQLLELHAKLYQSLVSVFLLLDPLRSCHIDTSVAPRHKPWLHRDWNRPKVKRRGEVIWLSHTPEQEVPTAFEELSVAPVKRTSLCAAAAAVVGRKSCCGSASSWRDNGRKTCRYSRMEGLEVGHGALEGGHGRPGERTLVWLDTETKAVRNKPGFLRTFSEHSFCWATIVNQLLVMTLKTSDGEANESVATCA